MNTRTTHHLEEAMEIGFIGAGAIASALAGNICGNVAMNMDAASGPPGFRPGEAVRLGKHGYAACPEERT